MLLKLTETIPLIENVSFKKSGKLIFPSLPNILRFFISGRICNIEDESLK
jgi:hypothetical protein